MVSSRQKTFKILNFQIPRARPLGPPRLKGLFKIHHQPQSRLTRHDSTTSAIELSTEPDKALSCNIRGLGYPKAGKSLVPALGCCILKTNNSSQCSKEHKSLLNTTGYIKRSLTDCRKGQSPKVGRSILHASQWDTSFTAVSSFKENPP